jgi:hypothetical protein
VREIRTLRAMWRALETGPRQVLNGHEGGNPGYKPRMSLRATAPVLDPTRSQVRVLSRPPLKIPTGRTSCGLAQSHRSELQRAKTLLAKRIRCDRELHKQR